MSARILIAEDNAGLREVISESLGSLGHEVQSEADGAAAQAALDKGAFDLLVTDLRMPGMDGMQLLEWIKEQELETGVIMITAHGTIQTAVDAMAKGAADFVEKPFELSELEVKVTKALEKRSLTAEVRRLRLEDEQRFGDLIGGSDRMREVFKKIEKVAPVSTPVLVLGESGTGKELVAREIHRRSPRADRPFVAVNCAALAPGVLESELFGHEPGAFTGATKLKHGRFEQANEGTLFLDEVGDIPLETQVKLLRFLQERTLERVGGNRTIKVDVRVVCATNRDLEEATKDKSFREDLYFRINVIPITLPPLKQRREDIPLLVDALLARHSKSIGYQGLVSEEALSLLQLYDWPGNVRELENVLERALVLADRDPTSGKHLITASSLPRVIAGGEGSNDAQRKYMEATGLMAQIERIEREIIRKALIEHGWNQTQTAKALQLKRSSLQYKMKKYELSKPEDDPA